MNSSKQQSDRQGQNGGGQSEPTEMGLGFWNPLEMGSARDSYSFLDQDTSVEGNGGYTMAQNFEFIGGGAPGGQGGHRETMAVPAPKKSAKENQFDAEMERYMAMRNQGVPQMPKRLQILRP